MVKHASSTLPGRSPTTARLWKGKGSARLEGRSSAPILPTERFGCLPLTDVGAHKAGTFMASQEVQGLITFDLSYP